MLFRFYFEQPTASRKQSAIDSSHHQHHHNRNNNKKRTRNLIKTEINFRLDSRPTNILNTKFYWRRNRRFSLFRTHDDASRIISSWESGRAECACILPKPCHAKPSHMQITPLYIFSYCFCRHDWYAFVPFEYQIRVSSALRSRYCSFRFSSVKACLRIRLVRS